MHTGPGVALYTSRTSATGPPARSVTRTPTCSTSWTSTRSGPPQLCVQRLADTIAATGTGRLLLMVEGAGDPTRTLTNIARLGAEVLPHLRA